MLAVAGCGGGGGSTSLPKGKDVATGAGRIETPDIVLETGRRPPRHSITLDGKRFSSPHAWLLPIEMKLTNRRKHRLGVGRMSAEVVSRGRHYPPIYADGRAAAAPIFADRSIRVGEAAHTLVLYRLPERILPKALLRIRDPQRGATYNLRLF
jgi:hypothetical protein